MRHIWRLIAAGAALSMATLGWAMASGGPATAVPSVDHAALSDAHAGGPLLVASLAPSVPSDPAIFGVGPGGVPWQLSAGHVVLTQSGKLVVSVARLVVPALGTNPVPGLAASVYCNGTLAATTPAVPFSTQGNATIVASVMLPQFCPAPAVLLKPVPPAGLLNVYIAFDGTT